ncbi:MAG: tetratricopeptide repeat protein [Acidobacteria bacterium]|nr:tetratricopeptide repeat protein [Acidobacteriota bacterium]MBS1866174.1 tetratricopeptide repeat protein [Acidobacteriota bacterium]
MSTSLFRRIVLILAMFPSICAAPLLAQENSTPPSAAEDPYQAQRKFAITLLNQQKHLEALPVFESLARQNPNDPEVIFGWGACLLQHSAIVMDPKAAKQERARARELLARSRELGKKSGLLENLLEMVPPDGGEIAFSSAGNVDAAMKAGEAAFARNDYEEAIKNYTRAAELDPKNYQAVLFIGDAYFSEKQFPKAVEWYDRAIALDPDMETGYRYEADLYIKSGEMDKARTRSIQAVVANPYNQATWRALNYWANSNKLQLTPVHINAASKDAKESNKGVQINIDPKSSSDEMAFALTVWMIYSGTRDDWTKERFKKQFPKEAQYRHSLAEESDALSEAAKMLPQSVQARDLRDPSLALLKRVYDAKMIEPYILISAPDRDIALNDYVPYREQHRDRLEAYLSQFIVPPTPAPKN